MFLNQDVNTKMKNKIKQLFFLIKAYKTLRVAEADPKHCNYGARLITIITSTQNSRIHTKLSQYILMETIKIIGLIENEHCYNLSL